MGGSVERSANHSEKAVDRAQDEKEVANAGSLPLHYARLPLS